MRGALPDHVLEMLHRGRLADNTQAARCWVRAGGDHREVIDQLYRWPSIIHTPPEQVA